MGGCSQAVVVLPALLLPLLLACCPNPGALVGMVVMVGRWRGTWGVGGPMAKSAAPGRPCCGLSTCLTNPGCSGCWAVPCCCAGGSEGGCPSGCSWGEGCPACCCCCDCGCASRLPLCLEGPPAVCCWAGAGAGRSGSSDGGARVWAVGSCAGGEGAGV